MDAPDWSDMDHGLFSISVAAELAGLHPQTLRIYEREGLLQPVRTVGGNRRYSRNNITRLQQIGTLTADGLNMAGIRRVLQLQEETRHLQTEIARLQQAAPAAAGRETRNACLATPVKYPELVLRLQPEISAGVGVTTDRPECPHGGYPARNRPVRRGLHQPHGSLSAASTCRAPSRCGARLPSRGRRTSREATRRCQEEPRPSARDPDPKSAEPSGDAPRKG